jgi:hypothetical protein
MPFAMELGPPCGSAKLASIEQVALQLLILETYIINLSNYRILDFTLTYTKRLFASLHASRKKKKRREDVTSPALS